MSSKSYPVYKVKFHISLPDPHMPPGRKHHAIFVQTGEDNSGVLYNVVGDITSIGGMTYESERTEDPRTLETFDSEELLGYTDADSHPEQWNSVLGSLPTPPQQKAPNPQNQGRVEPFKEKINDYEYVFYGPADEPKPLWKCTEWTEQYALPTLQQCGLIKFMT
jgi:hypothetical protein